MNTVEFVDGNAPGISAALLNEPFHLKGASYDEGVITVTIGPGRANFGGGLSGIIEKLADSTLTISAPVLNTTYYIFIEPDGSFSYDTSSLPKMRVLIGSVATGDPVSILTRDDLRGILPGPIVLKTSGIQVFNSSGIFTVPPGVTTVYVTICGGGGGGTYYSSIYFGGGAGEGYYRKKVIVRPNETINITVGIGGGDRQAGGISSFGTYLSCSGGGAPVVGSTGHTGWAGGPNAEPGSFERGGDSLFGIGGRYSSSATAAIVAGEYGSGGHGSVSPSCNGANGVVIVEW